MICWPRRRPWACPPTACCVLLAVSGLRIGEATGLNVEDLDHDGFYLVFRFVRKGGRLGQAVLARPTEAAVLGCITDRPTGPLFVNRAGRLVGSERLSGSSTEPPELFTAVTRITSAPAPPGLRPRSSRRPAAMVVSCSSRSTVAPAGTRSRTARPAASSPP
jgi:hypothetical protein